MSEMIEYVGRFLEVRVPDLGNNIWVKHGESIKVEDDDLRERLLEQPTNWQPVKNTKPKAKPKQESATDQEEGDTE